MIRDESILSMCLYFTSNRFARYMTKIAEEAFAETNLSPNYIYLILIVYQNPGITQKEICEKMSIAPSTSTRFIDKLEKLNLVYRQSEGKETHIRLSNKGVEFCKKVDQCFDELDRRYTSILGKEKSHKLAAYLYESCETMKNS